MGSHPPTTIFSGQKGSEPQSAILYSFWPRQKSDIFATWRENTNDDVRHNKVFSELTLPTTRNYGNCNVIIGHKFPMLVEIWRSRKIWQNGVLWMGYLNSVTRVRLRDNGWALTVVWVVRPVTEVMRWYRDTTKLQILVWCTILTHINTPQYSLI